MTVRDTDRGARALTGRLERLARTEVHVTAGVHEDAGTHPSGLPVAELAGIVEFGTDKVPPRPFVRGAVDDAETTLERDLAQATERVARQGTPIPNAFSGVATKLRDDMKRRVGSGETGTLHDSIEAKVNGGAV